MRRGLELERESDEKASRWAFDRPLAWAGLLALAFSLVGAVAVLDALAPHEDAAAVARAQGRAAREAMGWRPLPGEPAVTAGEWRVELLHATKPFLLPAASGLVSGAAAEGELLARTARLVTTELGRYQPRLLHRAGLERVLLCDRLRQEGKPIPSLPNVENTLLLEVVDDEAYLRRLLHHEFFHFLDYADDGHLRPDAAWEALNSPTFRYGEGGRAMRQPGAAEPLEPPPLGFINLYGTSGVEEDKAELFSFCLTEPARVDALARGDAILAAKRDELRRRVEGMVPGGVRW